MARYQIWNKTDDIYTPAGTKFTAAEWADRYPWVKAPKAKMVITAGDPEEGDINGGVAINFKQFVQQYKRAGVHITDDMTDEEAIAAIEAFEDMPPEYGLGFPTAEERTAAALEYLVLNNMPDEA